MCRRINEISAFNTVLFLHQFLFYCVQRDGSVSLANSLAASLVAVVEDEPNLLLLLDNLQRFPSESLLTLLSHVIHSHVVSPDEDLESYFAALAEFRIPSILINLLSADSDLSQAASLAVDGLSPDELVASCRLVVARIRVLALDILDAFYSGLFVSLASRTVYCVLPPNSGFVLRLLSLMRQSLHGSEESDRQTVQLASRILVALSLNRWLVSSSSRRGKLRIHRGGRAVPWRPLRHAHGRTVAADGESAGASAGAVRAA